MTIAATDCIIKKIVVIEVICINFTVNILGDIIYANIKNTDKFY